jgi:hypothetical protein
MGWLTGLIIFEIVETIIIIYLGKELIMSKNNRRTFTAPVNPRLTTNVSTNETMENPMTTKESIAKSYMASTAADMENDNWKLSEKKKIEKARDEELLVIKVAKDRATKDFLEMLENDFKPEEEAIKEKYKKLLTPFAMLNEDKVAKTGQEWGTKAADAIKSGPVGVGVETVRTFLNAFKRDK